MTASIRPDWVAIDQLGDGTADRRRVQAARGGAAGRRRAPSPPPAGLGAPCGALKPAPQLPSGARSDCAASRSLNLGAVSSSKQHLRGRRLGRLDAGQHRVRVVQRHRRRLQVERGQRHRRLLAVVGDHVLLGQRRRAERRWRWTSGRWSAGTGPAGPARSEERPVASARSAPTVRLLGVAARAAGGRGQREQAGQAGRVPGRLDDAGPQRLAAVHLLEQVGPGELLVRPAEPRGHRLAAWRPRPGCARSRRRWPGANAVAPPLLSRSSQVEESGTQTSGVTAVPLACPTPASWRRACGHRGGHVDRLGRRTRSPDAGAADRGAVLHPLGRRGASTAGRELGAAATASRISPEQLGPDQLLVAEPGRRRRRRREPSPPRRRLLHGASNACDGGSDTLTILRISCGLLPQPFGLKLRRRNS